MTAAPAPRALAVDEQQAVRRARALLEASRDGDKTLAAHLGYPVNELLYTRALGAAQYTIDRLLDIITDLTERAS